MFCRHNWKLIDKTILPRAIREVEHFTSHSTADTQLMLEAMRERVVHVFQCEKCTKVKKV